MGPAVARVRRLIAARERVPMSESPWPGHFRRLARYNAWANGRLYGGLHHLDDTAYFADRPSFFGSIHRTLSHVLVADRIWLGRITGRGSDMPSLDHVPYADRKALAAARGREDARLEAVIDALPSDCYDDVLAYQSMVGAAQTTPMVLVLTHLFNHQTHHRGQAHQMLSACGVAPPPLDLIYFLREAHESAG